MVNIAILYTNEHPPKFDKHNYQAKIPENAKLDSIVCSVHAQDVDKNKIEYSIHNNHELPFFIEKHKGDIKVNGRIDYELHSKYLIEVIASDGNYSDHASVEVNVVNLIDRAPYFEYNKYTFRIKIPNDVYIGKVKAIDVENTGSIKYALKFNNSNDSKLFCVSQTGVLHICPAALHSFSNTSNTSTNLKASNYDDALFGSNDYAFNVSVSIYSSDLRVELENHAECKIQLEHTRLIAETNNSSRILSNNNQTQPFMLYPTFLNEHMLKDKASIYLFVGVIAGSILLVVVFMAALIWSRCKTEDSKSKQSIIGSRSSYSQNEYDKTISNSIKGAYKTPLCFFSSFNSKVNKAKNPKVNISSYSGSSIDCDGPNCYNSSSENSSGISCLSVCTSTFNQKGVDAKQLESSKNRRSESLKLKSTPLYYLQWEEKNGENGILYETCRPSSFGDNVDNRSPISKITLLSDYMDSEAHLVKSITITSKNNAETDVLTSSTSTLKTRETPVKLENFQINQTNEFLKSQDMSKCFNNQQIKNINQVYKELESEIKSTKDTKFKLPKENKEEFYSVVQKAKVNKPNAPRLQTFYSSPDEKLPSPINSSGFKRTFHVGKRNPESNRSSTGLNEFTNLGFNQHEPLSLNSETNFDNQLTRTDRSLYEEMRHVEEIGDDGDVSLSVDNPTPRQACEPSANSLKHKSFQNHLNMCNSSLVRLVNIMQNNPKDDSSGNYLNNEWIGGGENAYENPNHSFLSAEPVENASNDYYNSVQSRNDEVGFTWNRNVHDRNKSVARAFKFLNSKPPHGFRDKIQSNKTKLKSKLCTNTTLKLSNTFCVRKELTNSLFNPNSKNDFYGKNTITKNNIINVKIDTNEDDHLNEANSYYNDQDLCDSLRKNEKTKNLFNLISPEKLVNLVNRKNNLLNENSLTSFATTTNNYNFVYDQDPSMSTSGVSSIKNQFGVESDSFISSSNIK
jgi:hypothetical protein